MALKISLKPHERMIIDGAVVTNGSVPAELLIENRVPILRQKDILTETDADSPGKRIYLVIQLMYIDEDKVEQYHQRYWELVKDFLKAAPSALNLIDKISELILNGKYYNALKAARHLIDYEEEVVKRVYPFQRSKSLPAD